MQTGFKVGDKVLIGARPHSCNFYVLSRVDNSDNTLKFWLDKANTVESTWHKFSDVTLLIETEEYITKQKQELINEVQLVDSKIQWMKESGSDVFNNSQFRIWQVLTLTEDSSISKMEKVKAIAELIK